METTKAQTIVVGGGISGLTAAWHLHAAGRDVRLLEADSSVGGAMRTEHRDGFLLEKGPFNVIVRDPAFQELLEAMSPEIEVVSAAKPARKRFIYRNRRMIKVPTDPVSLLFSPILSFGAKLRLLGGLLVSRRPGDGECTIDDFAARRLGREAADTLVSAAISGILAGDTRDLSLPACFPSIGEFDRNAISPIIYGIRKAFGGKKDKSKPKRRWRGLVSINAGLGGLCDAIAGKLGERVVTNCRVDSIAKRTRKAGWRVAAQVGAEARMYEAKELVLATPVQVTARLLEPHAPEVSRELAAVKSASLVVINLAFKESDIGHPMEGFGFLVPRNEPEFPLMGVLWADSAFPHHGKEGYRLLRAFLGGTRTPDAVERTDEQLLELVQPALRDLLSIASEPTLVDVCRYPGAIPQYHLGHAERIEHAIAETNRLDGLHLIGNYVHGVSINDCVRTAKTFAMTMIGGDDRNEQVES